MGVEGGFEGFNGLKSWFLTEITDLEIGMIVTNCFNGFTKNNRFEVVLILSFRFNGRRFSIREL